MLRAKLSSVRRMTDARKSGIALIAASAAMVITMAIHPRGLAASPDQAESVARMLIAVHALALASIPVMFLGAWGLSRRLDGPDRLAMSALVVFGFGAIALANAAVFDGLVMPALIRRLVASATDATKQEGWHLAMRYNFELNQAYARLYAVASGVALLLWSIAIVRKNQLSRTVGIYGCILGPVTVVAISSGLLTPSVHGFGILAVLQALWFVSVGAQLLSAASEATPAAG